MSYYSKDVYYDPEHFNLVPVAEIEWSEPFYSFDTTVVWKKKGTNNVFYWASDSGCSCPGQFESYTSMDKLEKGTKAQACRAIQSLLDEAYDKTYAEPQVVEALIKIQAA